MNIALVVPGGVDRTGEYRVIPALLALIKRLSARHEVHVFAFNQEERPATWVLAGAKIHNIGAGRTRWRAVQAICAQHRVSRFDVIHAIWSGAMGMVAVTAARLLGIPSLIHIAGGELVAIHEISYGGRLTWRGRLREALVLRAACAVTAASDPILKSLARMGIPACRVPLGVDLDAWPPRAPVRRTPGEPVRLIHAASLNRVKDQSTLLAALACLAKNGIEFQADVIGEDTLRGEIQALACHLRLEQRVRFHGFLTQRQLRPHVESAHLMLMSSLHEAGPLVTLEAAVAGVPTVGTAVGHIAEWTPDAALAVPVGDSTALAGAIHRLLDNEDLRLRIAHNAFLRAGAENADRTAASFEALYTQTMAHGA